MSEWETRLVADSFELHYERRGLFGDDVDAYDFGRPGYPERVFELLRHHCGLAPGVDVLEIGPGTGQATARLLEHGANVTAVELDPKLADRLGAKHRGASLHVVVGAFEDIDIVPSSFDLVVAATSFHWMLPVDSALRRCGLVLRPGGWLAMWWNVFGDASRPDPFHDALTPLLSRVAPTLLDPPGAGNPTTGAHPHALDTEARIQEIDAVRLFEAVHHEDIRWTARQTASQLRLLFASFSPWLALPIEPRLVALDALERLANEEFGGVVERPYVTPVYLARRQ